MASASYRKIAIDIPAIRADIRRLQPETITLEEILEALEPDIREQLGEGVPAADIAKALEAHGVTISPRRIQAKLKPRRPGEPPPSRPSFPAESE